MLHNRLSLRPRRAVGIRTAVASLAVLAISALAYTAVSTKVTLDRRAAFAENMMERVLTSVDDLANRVNEEQDFYLRITPPDPNYILRQTIGLIAFDAQGFPTEVTKTLVPAIEQGCPVYTVTVDEDPITRDLTLYNADGKPIYAIHPYKDYDPYRLLNQLYPDLSTTRYAPAYAAWLKGCYDPSRVQIVLKLMSTEWIEDYAETRFTTLAEEAAVAMSLNQGGGMTMMRSLAASNSIVIQAFTHETNGMKLEIGYPNTFTNRLEIFACINLVPATWSLLATNLSTAGTNTIYWTDTNMTANVFYYNADNADVDSDADGLTDAREHFIYHTSETNIDSDGDGLVDGYSGVVSTNAYPGGATTNGGRYVEGEMTWGTNPKLFDTDGDGMGDGWEVSHGHRPLDPNDPPNVLGTIFYSGRQTGTIWVIAVTSSNSWSTNYCKVLTNSVTYQIPNLPGTNYWLKAWLDTNNNGTNNAAEAWGACTNNPVLVTNQVTGRNITLTDPDGDSDNLPDWWEIKYFGGTNVTAGTNDVDGDTYSNLEEYQANTDPTDITSHPWNISGTIYYAGPQTGTIYVIASTSSTGWVAAQCTTNASPGPFAITHLPPTNYWVRAWRDTYADHSNTFWEAWGTNSGGSIYLGPNATNANVTLFDPDSDGDGLPDWWEVKYGLDPFNGNGASAAAWWKFDEGSGTNIQDSTANANNGVLYNAPSNAWTYGVMSNAVTFNGTNTYAQFQNSASLTSTTVSVSLWIKPAHDYTNGSAVFFSKKDPTASTGYRLSYEQGALVFLICASGNKTVSLPYALTNGVWHNVVGTYGGANHRLYVDGVLLVSTNYNWDPPGAGNIVQGTTAPRIGASTDTTPSNYFAGVIDDTRVYGNELTSNEVHAVYELGADPDGDGLSNFDEYRYGTCPTNSDTDGDGISDGTEVHVYGTDPAHTINATLPFAAGFESTNGYAAGALDGQQGWTAAPADGVSVQSIVARSGFQAVQSAGLAATYSHGLASTATVVTAETWTFWNPTQTAPPTNLPAGATTLVSFNATAGVVAFDGDGLGGGNWVTASNTLFVSQWVDLKVEQNYSNKTWRLWVNGNLKLSNLKFKDNIPARLRAVNIKDGTGGPLFLDDVKVEAQP